MKFFNQLKSFTKISKSAVAFGAVEGYSDVKEIVKRALDSEENYNLLFCGPPASSKTLFLQGIQEIRQDAIYFDSSNTTNRILDVLEEKIILLDELDKMSKPTMNQILNLLESGHVKVDQQKKQYDFEIRGLKVFGSANDISKVTRPLQSRFRKIFLSRYTEQQFIEVSIKVLKNISDPLARYIGITVFKNGGDIRDVISVGRLIKRSDTPEDVNQIINTLMKYSNEEGQRK